ncbi:MAG: efflux RND transporter periplasmic adaptor subunit [Planctomycetota bacterium]|nr:MAG: efflux RND transporter periplasmic adaptor subunit [Planctomycetota bacterium]
MNQNTTLSGPTAITRLLWTASALVAPLSLLAALSGCSDSDSAPALTSTTAAQAAAHDHDGEHDHDDASESGHADETAHADEVVLTSDAVVRYGILTQVARREVLRATIVAPARVGFDTEAMAHVGSPLRGRAIDVRVRVGDAVKVGSELVIVESPELGEAQAEFLQRRVAVQTAEPAVDLTRVTWDRARGLYERSQGISLTEVQRREAEHKAAIAALKAAESARTAAADRLRMLGMDSAAIAALATSGEVLPRFTIRAAIHGVVVQREVTLGELVSPEREYLMVLADATKLWVLADVPETRLLNVRVGAAAWISVGSPGDEGHRRATGSVTFISPFVDPTTRTAQVRIGVPAQDVGLRPGMFAQAEIVVGPAERSPAEAAIVVPEEAIQTIDGAAVLFVPVDGEANTYRKRAIAIGTAVGGLVPVHSGLTEGEPFVSAGTFILKAELGKGAAAHEH